jgi:hypothetical protein
MKNWSIRSIFVTVAFVLSGCSLLYMNAVRRDTTSIRFVGGEPRKDVCARLGTPIYSTLDSDTFRIRGRLDGPDGVRMAGAMTAFTFGLGEIVLFPYVLVTESTAAVFDSFCVRVLYDKESRASGYQVNRECRELK